MNLTLKRDVFSEKFTLGKLTCEDKHIGYTCEDTDRKLEEGNAKVYGETAIPRGKYRVIVSFSNRFKKPLPEVLGVNGFSGIRIHGGNRAADSLGCPLLGSVRTSDGVANCGPVNKRLIEMLEQAEDAGDEVWLTVE